MGLLRDGTRVQWEDMKVISKQVRYRGALQFLNQYNKHKSRDGDPFLWGDEGCTILWYEMLRVSQLLKIEYLLVKFDHKSKKAVVNLISSDVLKNFRDEAKSNDDSKACWHPELAKYMVEGTPGRPYGMNGITDIISSIKTNMKIRRQLLVSMMGDNEHVLTVPAFPRLGCGVFTSHETTMSLNAGRTQSALTMDELTTDNPRFMSVMQSIQNNRGEKVAINIPVFRDKRTPSPFHDNLQEKSNNADNVNEALPNCIYMDHPVFGAGCCCIQVTFQAKNLDEAKVLYDQLIPFSPIMLALSAASPLCKGYVSDYDTRWPVFIQSVDDRTQEERRVKAGKNGHRPARVGSVDCYLTSSRHNDKCSSYDEEIFTILKSEGVDELLAKHISHQFIHDPLTLYQESLDQDDAKGSDIFETIHSNNWRIVRLKLPIPEQNIGWRVEFRPMDVQLTDFENAAYVVFVTLLTRVILMFGLDFTMPLSKVDCNLETASRRNAVLEETFYFKKDVEANNSSSSSNQICPIANNDEDRVIPMTIKEILHGKGQYRGVMYYMHKYIERTDDFDEDAKLEVTKYINLISDRAVGQLKTRAKWVRDFVGNHPEYKQDSVVSDVINYDLLLKCAELSDS